jgi:hypothetical protein
MLIMKNFSDKSRIRIKVEIILVSSLLFFLSCNSGNRKNKDSMEQVELYTYDLEFLTKHNIRFKELKDKDSNASLIVVPGWQGRIMTSTDNRTSGESFGWINYKLIESGEINHHFNPFGGEERIWLGPEGGPFSIYFDKGNEQVIENWRVPKQLDTEAYKTVDLSESSIRFKKDFTLSNASGYLFDIMLDREVQIFSRKMAENYLGLALDESLSLVSYQSKNILTNNGESAWNNKTGALSIWILCMFNPSEKGVVFIPFKEGNDRELGPVVNDSYFGKVPEDRVVIEEGVIYFQTDGKYRSKLGVSPKRALPYCGSYDPVKQKLTVLWYSSLDRSMPYVNSIWGNQDNPFDGDAVNTYNDGPLEDGSIFGPFYEIESSSPAAFLAPGERVEHIQRIFHISGDESKLNDITKELFGLSIEKIKSVFEK